MRRYDALDLVDPGLFVSYIQTIRISFGGWIMNKVFLLFQYIPVLGLFVKEAIEGPDSTKINFLLNLVMVWLLCIYAFGYPAIIAPLLVVAPGMILILVGITFQPSSSET